MSGKRIATTDLNHTNWDQEEKPEDKGIFATATAEELKNRVIKKARRKLPETDDTENPNKSVFSGFAGFGPTSSSSTVSSTAFSFLSKIGSSPLSSSTDLVKKDPPTTTGIDSTENNNNYKFEKSNNYYAKLKGLNQALSNWVKSHVDKNPVCILTPIFKDYEKYLKEIQNAENHNTEKFDNKLIDNKSVETKSSTPSSTAQLSTFKFSSGSPATIAPDTTKKFSFTTSASTTPSQTTEKISSSMFGKTESAKTVQSTEKSIPTFGGFGSASSSSGGIFGGSSNTSGFSFGQTAKTDSVPSSSFSFSGTKPFSFGSSVTKPANDQSGSNTEKPEEDEDDEPPKVEFKAVVEEDSIYSKKCKVFVKHDGNYGDRGVGTLYLKPVKDSEKTQLLVRADTNLGNILLNLILSDGIPTQRMGKNNVMMVCIPTPESDQKPTSTLIRVKTGEEADELLETINKYKK